VELTCKDAKGNTYTTTSDTYNVLVSENNQADSNISITPNIINDSNYIQKMGYLAAIIICGFVAAIALIRKKKN